MVTHYPGETLNWLIKENFDFDVILAPFNMAGFFMDLSPVEAKEIYRKIGKPVIGKKILGAGRLNVKEALEFASKSNCLAGVALGVTSIEEARETFSIALKLFDF